MIETAQKIRLLIVDDDVDICDLMCLIAEEAGFDVASANDGRGFRAAFNEHTPDLVTMDLAMPDCDGLELMRFMDEENYGGDIIASSHDEKMLKQIRPFGEMLGLNIRAVLGKPFKSEEYRSLLLNRVDQVL